MLASGRVKWQISIHQKLHANRFVKRNTSAKSLENPDESNPSDNLGVPPNVYREPQKKTSSKNRWMPCASIMVF